MKKIFLIMFLFFFALAFSSAVFVLAKTTPNPQPSGSSPAPATNPSSPNVFYDQIRNAAHGPSCLQGSTALAKIISCMTAIASKLRIVAAVLFSLAIVVAGAYLIFGETLNSGWLKWAKTILIWSTIGFAIIFGYAIVEAVIRSIAK